LHKVKITRSSVGVKSIYRFTSVSEDPRETRCEDQQRRLSGRENLKLAPDVFELKETLPGSEPFCAKDSTFRESSAGLGVVA
jgi:hypothetical protein